MKTALKTLTVAAIMATSAAAGAASAQSTLGWSGKPEVIGQYTAYISQRDLRSSEGTRLTQAWQVIRQDRANYHRFNRRDRGDQGDTFFGSAQNRAIMERMVRDGEMSPSAARAIVGGDVSITVRIYGHDGVGQYVVVVVN
nr:hypothetical protein [uncultured Brevundimonas sp.]